MPKFSKQVLIVVAVIAAIIITSPVWVRAQSVSSAYAIFTSALNGLAPASGGGTTNFLRADGSWAAPGGGGGGSPGGSYSEYQYRGGTSTFSAATNTGPVPITGWTATSLTSGTSVSNFSQDKLSFGYPNVASFTWSVYCRTLSSAPYSAIFTVEYSAPDITSTGADAFGFGISDGTKLETEILANLANTHGAVQLNYTAAFSSGGSALAGPTNLYAGRATLKVADDSTNRKWYYWNNGAFVQLYSEASGTNLTPNLVCVIGAENTGAVAGFPTLQGVVDYVCVSSTSTCNGN